MVSKLATWTIAGASIVLIQAQALAADFSVADETYTPPESGWDFRFTPYGWLTSISGDITARGRTVDISASFIDIVDDSDYIIPLMGYFEARNGRLSLFSELFYTQIGFSSSNLVQRNPIAGLELTLKSKAGLTQTLAFAEAGAAYEVATWEQSTTSSTALDVLAGARYWYAAADLSLKITGTVNLTNLGLQKKGKYAIARSGDTDWVDPVIGMRVRQQIAPGHELQFLGDIGGFGVGSEFTWQVYAGYSHEFHVGNTTMAGTIGYRALAFNYESGSGKTARTFDINLHGPIAGLSFRW